MIPTTSAALAGALQAVVSDPERHLRMSRAARKVAEQYTWERMADKYMALFKGVRSPSFTS